MSATSQPATRTRTGCRTCRKRRKKCDERKPMCKNCEKTNVVCEGFPPRKKWKELDSTLGDDSNSTITDQSEHALDSSLYDQFTADHHSATTSYGHSMPIHYDASEHFIQDTQPYSTSTTSFGGLQGYSSQTELLSNVEPSNNSRTTVTDVSLPIQWGTSFVPESIPLPSILPGSHTQSEMTLYSHFVKETSEVLIAPGPEGLRSVLLKLSSDPIVLDSILCLSASHLLATQGASQDQDLLSEKQHLYESVVHAQSQRMQTSERQPWVDPNINNQLATALLLYFYDICEGNPNWPTHLGMARQILEIPSKVPEGDSDWALKADPVLLESFLFLDRMSSITVVAKQAHVNLVYNASRTGAMFGIKDGIVDIAPRIAAIRRSIDAGAPRWDVMTKGCDLGIELIKRIQPLSCLVDNDRMAKLYLRSFWVLLFSTLHPYEISNDKVKTVRLQMMSDIANIAKNLRAYLLFPLCILGFIAIEETDRKVVRVQFEELKQWSAFGNIPLWQRVVEMMWMDYDNNLPNAWDWVSKLNVLEMRLSFF